MPPPFPCGHGALRVSLEGPVAPSDPAVGAKGAAIQETVAECCPRQHKMELMRGSCNPSTKRQAPLAALPAADYHSLNDQRRVVG